MARNSYYSSAHWRTLKHATHQRDGWKCIVPGCGSTLDLVCDHIQTRPNIDTPTSADTLANTRTLCGAHDRQIKEGREGKRRREGKPIVAGCDANGNPRDPNHPWHQRGRS